MEKIIVENKTKIQSIIKRFTGFSNEDLEQEIFLKAWKKLDTYKEQNKFSQWICVIAANMCKDFLKSKTFKSELNQIDKEGIVETLSTFEHPEKIYDKKLRQKLILKAVNNLPKKMREVVILFEFEDYSYEEISRKLKVPEGTVKSRLFSARKLLSQQLIEFIGD